MRQAAERLPRISVVPPETMVRFRRSAGYGGPDQDILSVPIWLGGVTAHRRHSRAAAPGSREDPLSLAVPDLQRTGVPPPPVTRFRRGGWRSRWSTRMPRQQTG